MAITFLASLNDGQVRVFLVTDDATGGVIGVRTRNATRHAIRVTLADDGAAETVLDEGTGRTRRLPDEEMVSTLSRSLRPVAHTSFKVVIQPTLR